MLPRLPRPVLRRRAEFHPNGSARQTWIRPALHEVPLPSIAPVRDYRGYAELMGVTAEGYLAVNEGAYGKEVAQSSGDPSNLGSHRPPAGRCIQRVFGAQEHRAGDTPALTGSGEQTEVFHPICRLRHEPRPHLRHGWGCSARRW